MADAREESNAPAADAEQPVAAGTGPAAAGSEAAGERVARAGSALGASAAASTGSTGDGDEVAAVAAATAELDVSDEDELPYTADVKTYLVSLQTAPVISWQEALVQVDNDRDFLFELLQDLYRETKEHVAGVSAGLAAWNVREIQQHAHAVKGAAANVMCYRLRWSAGAVEQACKDQMAGKYDEAVLKRMMAYRVPVFCQEFDVFVDMLRINELLPQDEE